MKHEFWHDKWQKNEIGFHLNQPHSLLVKYIDSLNLEKNNRIFLPLCGKSLDIHWLLAQGYHLIGIDLSPIAIEELMAELAIPFTERKLEKLIGMLPPVRQRVFYLSRINNYSHKEIAKMLSISPKTVENHINLALKFIKPFFILILLFNTIQVVS